MRMALRRSDTEVGVKRIFILGGRIRLSTRVNGRVALEELVYLFNLGCRLVGRQGHIWAGRVTVGMGGHGSYLREDKGGGAHVCGWRVQRGGVK